METVDVVLQGGPRDFPEDARKRRATTDESTIKIMHRGGYEHFERASQSGDATPVVYRWTLRTRIAE
jgi:Family of unknown function (DUF5988)